MHLGALVLPAGPLRQLMQARIRGQVTGDEQQSTTQQCWQCAGSYLNGKSLWVHHKAVVEHLAVLPIKTEPLEELERSCLARTRHSLAQLRQAALQGQQDGLEESELQQQRASISP